MSTVYAGLMLALITPGGHPPYRVSDWELLGSRVVSFAAERDVVPVTAGEGRFTAIRLEVEAGNLDLYNIRIVFGDGDVFSPEIRVNFRQSTASRTIDLPGGARVIRRIEFAYRSEVRRGRAVVRVYGLQSRRAAAPPSAPGPGDARFPGWSRLGERTVSFRAERDVISAAGQGAFHRVMLVVDDADLELFNVRIVFGNGDMFSPETRLHFGEDSRSRVIDLPGEARIIRRIEFAYRSVRGGGDGRATVQVYAR